MLSTPSPKARRCATGAKPLTRLLRSPDREPENSNDAMSALLTETEVSHVLRVSLATLQKWRVDKRGPSFTQSHG